MSHAVFAAVYDPGLSEAERDAAAVAAVAYCIKHDVEYFEIEAQGGESIAEARARIERHWARVPSVEVTATGLTIHTPSPALSVAFYIQSKHEARWSRATPAELRTEANARTKAEIDAKRREIAPLLNAVAEMKAPNFGKAWLCEMAHTYLTGTAELPDEDIEAVADIVREGLGAIPSWRTIEGWFTGWTVEKMLSLARSADDDS